jgi:DNA repair exonuclease SbcCD nuclease subunit
MSILFIGDPHFRVDNVNESNKFIQEIKRILESYSIDFVVVLGDILHTHEKLHTFALNSAFQFFKMLTAYKKTYCLVGNHDATSNTIFLSDNHWLNILKEWDNLTIVDTPIQVSLANKNIIMCPYVPDGRFEEALNHISDWKTFDLVVGHQLLNGAKMGPIIASGVEEWKKEWPLLISGHIHDKQRPQSNIFYTGSAMQHAFGESGDKTLYLYNIALNEGEEISLHVPRKEIVYVDINHMENIEEKIENMIKNDITVKIVIKGDMSDIKATKDTRLIKKLENLKGVKSVIFKEKQPDNISSENKSVVNDNSDSSEKEFELILQSIVKTKDDVYLESLLNHMLSGGEDLSDKDVFFI